MDMGIRQHWDEDSANYNQFVVKGFSIRKEREAWQKMFLELLGKRNLKLLDVGCGPGIVSLQLAELGYQMTAIDFSEKMLAAAKKNADDHHLQINFHHGDAEALPFADESFEGVVSDYMLWTVPHPEKVIAEWFRVLQPGSKLVYVDGNWTSDPKMTKWNNYLSRCGVFLDNPRRCLQKKAQSNPQELWSAQASRPADDLKMLKAAGFTDIQVKHNIQEEVLHGIRYLAYGSTNDHFAVTAVKPKSA
ncbi:class I SAM-dependent methyltransferase [Candidatus Methanomassiliicoccus intestinalis]|uniref:class I SAM-dependent methyltransferase n=1 Tax=Candidatus Methanomassiliicoccus intestinalis TaxID=1406512 RepID=UPI0037DC7E64